MGKHDSIAKKFLQKSDVQHGVFQSLVPDNIKNRIRAETVREEKTDFIEDNLSQHFSDVLLSCQTVDGDDARIYCLIEHQHSYDKFMALRLFRYTIQILEREANNQSGKDKALPVVFPLVFYADRTSLTTDIYELFQNPELARQYTFQPFQVIQLNDYKRKDLKQLPAPTRLFVATIAPKGGHSLGLDMIEERDALIIEPLQHIGTDIINAMLAYFMQQTYDKSEEEIVTMMENNIPERSQEIRTAYDELIAKGEAKYLVKLVQNTNMTLEQAAKVLESSDEVIQLARKQLQK